MMRYTGGVDEVILFVMFRMPLKCQFIVAEHFENKSTIYAVYINA